MSKYTKIIAALGVAAGMGVASLPVAGVFAAEGAPITLVDGENGDTKDNKISTDLNLQVEIADVLKLTLDNVDDDNTNDANAAGNLLKVAMNASEISRALSTKATVFTNSRNGYTLKLAPAANVVDGATTTYYVDGALRHSTVATQATVSDATYIISPIASVGDLTDASTIEADRTDDTKAGWSVSYIENEGVPGATLSAAAQHAVSGELTLMTSSKPSKAAGDEINVTYNIHTLSNQASGTYKGRVTYTAEAQPRS